MATTKNIAVRIVCVSLLFLMSLAATDCFAQPSSVLPDTLKRLSIEELMNLEVTSVSKKAERLSSAASAIQVITRDDIRQSGATNVPEALRLATNLQVAQVNSSQWAISARGFNNVLANKLLVLIDGRTVYTPLYAGVFWDVQNLLLEDIERIEVISGPGGTLWGSNAVNGVINITTRSSKDTHGLYAEASTGPEVRGIGSLRYGAQIAENLHIRAYGTAFKRGATLAYNPAVDTTGDASDGWSMRQGGLRLDWDASEKDVATLQANSYSGQPDPDGGSPVIASGNNIITKWNHKSSEKSDYQIKVYFDQTYRDFRNKFTEDLKTYDLEWQHRFQAGTHNEVVWGAGYRFLDHTVTNLELFGFFPGHKKLQLFSAFVQDEVSVVQDRLKITLGAKIENYTYTGYQFQPNGRIAFTPNEHHTVWGAVSRAVRLPSRVDREFSVSLFPGFPVIQGSPTMKAEEVLAYELGWRLQPKEKISMSISSFYNIYNNIRGAESGPIGGYPITFNNAVEGKTYGAELSVMYPVMDFWRLRGGYTILKKDLSIKPGLKDANNATAESDDPRYQFLIQSMMTLPKRIELGAVWRYIDKLPQPHVRGYSGLDIRVSWKIIEAIDLSIVGQNLINDRHQEFRDGSASHLPHKIERSFYGKIAIRL